MDPSRPSPSERDREKRAAAARRRRASIRTGIAGLIVLFTSAIGAIVFLSAIVLFIALMVLGIGLILVAFLLIRTPVAGLLGPLGE